ncbi:exodeoxyribonuclease VII large subunit [Paenibacillaceae bacterium]|nr:exodeoxyribonuclease VII large subunit [Paenibacillaceae bacterium]
MAAEARIYSIKEINKYIRMKLESDKLLSDVWLRGEISNFTHHSSGHMYFTLKDRESRLKCIMFASHNQRLPFIPREGSKVMARGNISVYERDGNYQFYVTSMQPDGIGSLYLAFEQLKQKLSEEGLFAKERKRPIPLFPKAVGVITSPTGAAVRDVLITLQRRFPAVPVLVLPAVVQGRQAAPSLVKAIELMNQLNEVDVLIVGRGGGSLEELWGFNEETVARAIARSAIPIISAVGHETDFTIADFVADLRAATPTAAAELAVPHWQELAQQVDRNRQRLRLALQAKLRAGEERLQRMRNSRVFANPGRYLLMSAERLDRLKDKLAAAAVRQTERGRERYALGHARLSAHHPGSRVRYAADRWKERSDRLEKAMGSMLKARRTELHGAIRSLDALSPLKVMARGYSLVYDEHEERLMKSISEVQPGDLVKVKLADGRMNCHVWSLEGEKESNGESGNS